VEAVAAGAVAIFPWGDVVEEFLDPLGLSYEDYVREMSGGWLFGYVAALQAQGQRVVIVHASERVTHPVRLVHPPTGAPVWFVRGERAAATGERPNRRAIAQWARSPLAAFRRVLIQEGCGAILIQDYEHPRFDALTVLARRMGLPVFASFQGGDVTMSPIERRVRAFTLRSCQAIVVASRRERERLTAAYRLGPAKIVDIPNPVDTDIWRAEPRGDARASLGVDPAAFLVVNHGRIDIHRKGLDLLLAAWREVVGQAPQARLVIIGSGQDHATFAERVQGVAGLSWLSSYTTDRGMVRAWLSAANAYVTLSRIEGMPVAPLEAMACGLPVVASDAHGLADIFREEEACGGLIVPGGEPGAAADALVKLSRDPAHAATLGAAARREVERRYTPATVGRELLKTLAR